MLTVCTAFSCYKITFYKGEHNSLKSVPPVSGFLPQHHKILQFGHYACLLLVYFCAGYLGTSPSLCFLLPDLAPTSPVKILRVREGFFTFSSLWHNLQFSSGLIQKEMQNKPVTKLLPSLKISCFTRREGSNMRKTGLGVFERISRVAVIPSRQIISL